MAGRLQGKRVLATAAARGIGRASVLRMAAEGARVWATDVDRAALDLLEEQGQELVALELDVRDTEAISAFVDAHGPFDVLFNCAGYVHQGTILECDEEEWRRSLELNVTSMYRTIRAVLPGMLAAGGGSIVNMSSVASSVKGAPRRCVYGTTKAAVVGLTKAVAADYVGQGIRCNAICPGTVDTPSLHERIAALGDPDEARAAFVARQPIGRLGTPEEIAALVAYLASDEAGFTTGAVHVIDGGWST